MIDLADVILIVHALIAAFIAAGIVAIPIGAYFNWRFVRYRTLRVLHLFGILYVAAQTVFGMACPLTVWEDALRGATSTEEGFIAHWVRYWLYYDIPLWVFGVIYIVAAVATVVAWYAVPPAPRTRTSTRSERRASRYTK